MERLEAEFPTNSLYLCLEVFDLAAWESLISAARRSGTLPAEASLKVKEMRLKGRRLFEALGLEWNAQTFVSAVHSAMACAARLPDTMPQHLRNRASWAEALASAQGPEATHSSIALVRVEPALRFYWSFRDGTGDVERLLGRHLSSRASHPGPGSQFDDSAEIALEVAAEGPRDESAVAAQPAVPGGVLLLTPFSRECARIWRAVFGARFACRPRRKDVGRQFPGRQVGTLKRAKVQHKVAVRRLLEAAERDQNDPASKSRRQTVCGFRRRAIDSSEARAPKPGKSMRNFLKHTEAIKEARAKHRVWTGCQDVPRLRRKAKAVRLNRGQTVRLHAASAASRGAKGHAKGHAKGNWAGRRKPSSPPAAASTNAMPAALKSPNKRRRV